MYMSMVLDYILAGDLNMAACLESLSVIALCVLTLQQLLRLRIVKCIDEKAIEPALKLPVMP